MLKHPCGNFDNRQHGGFEGGLKFYDNTGLSDPLKTEDHYIDKIFTIVPIKIDFCALFLFYFTVGLRNDLPSTYQYPVRSI